MALKDDQGNWIDKRGRSVPQVHVKPLDRKKDSTVERIVNKGLKMQEQMKRDKKKFLEWIDNYIAALEKDARQKRNGKGNIVLTNFSGDKQVEFKINDVIEFDEHLHLAKAAIDECIKKWTKDANHNLKVVVDQAFEVDKKGNVNKMSILRLRQLNIKDEGWTRAMELIGESLSVNTTRKYLILRVRQDMDGAWQTVDLNFSSL